ncbi:MAG: hypothetical protein ACP5KE_07085 [Candidatus Methanodesulfokora sp.]
MRSLQSLDEMRRRLSEVNIVSYSSPEEAEIILRRIVEVFDERGFVGGRRAEGYAFSFSKDIPYPQVRIGVYGGTISIYIRDPQMLSDHEDISAAEIFEKLMSAINAAGSLLKK